MAIGCHSVSHPRISQQTPLRQQFEIAASKSLVERHHGACRWFAYPYGTGDSHSPATYAICKELGFDAVFTTTPGVISAPHDRLRLPRIAMPDAVLPVRLFDARARGGGIPMARIKEWLA
jgi:peptidoglycan/xylan/chitin deacetylase (PgdA/CDA1 family)